jgi:hypothetical protein
VRGNNGFWESTDAGVSWTKPAQFDSIVHKMASAGPGDLYDVAVDPTDFKHVLITFHYNWEGTYGGNSGYFESTDGGTHWIVHDPISGWGSGHSIKFLYDPAKKIGDNRTWLLMTQGDGYWRTTDAGANWKQVNTASMTHGGGTAYYAKTGILYVSGLNPMRSSDNGATWSTTNSPSGSWCIWGDGTTLYTAGSFGASPPIYTSSESSGTSWAPYNTTQFKDGPYEMAFDSVNGIMYSSQWTAGILALKVSRSTAAAKSAVANNREMSRASSCRLLIGNGGKSLRGCSIGHASTVYDIRGSIIGRGMSHQAEIVKAH